MFTLIFYNIITKLLSSTYSCIDFIHLIEKTINGCSIRQIFMKIVKHPPEDKSITLVRIKKKKTNKENVLSDDICLYDSTEGSNSDQSSIHHSIIQNKEVDCNDKNTTQ